MSTAPKASAAAEGLSEKEREQIEATRFAMNGAPNSGVSGTYMLQAKFAIKIIDRLIAERARLQAVVAAADRDKQPLLDLIDRLLVEREGLQAVAAAADAFLKQWGESSMLVHEGDALDARERELVAALAALRSPAQLEQSHDA
jgi:hypothetical protein